MGRHSSGDAAPCVPEWIDQLRACLCDVAIALAAQEPIPSYIVNLMISVCREHYIWHCSITIGVCHGVV